MKLVASLKAEAQPGLLEALDYEVPDRSSTFIKAQNCLGPYENKWRLRKVKKLKKFLHRLCKRHDCFRSDEQKRLVTEDWKGSGRWYPYPRGTWRLYPSTPEEVDRNPNECSWRDLPTELKIKILGMVVSDTLSNTIERRWTSPSGDHHELIKLSRVSAPKVLDVLVYLHFGSPLCDCIS